MYDFQSTVLIKSKPATASMVLRYVFLVLTALGLFACLWVNPVLFFMPTVVLGILWWWTWFHSGLEYEYSYFDGELDFDKVTDKRRRKHITTLNMESVVQIAPVGDRALYSVHQDSRAKCVDLSSKEATAKRYEVVSNDSGKVVCICFEPDERMLDAISVKYPRKVIR